MSTFTFDFSPTPAAAAGIQGPSTTHVVLSLLALHLASAKFTYPLYALLTNAIAWGTVYLTCRALPTPAAVGTKRRPLLLAGCILAAAICRRITRTPTHWEAALVPTLYVILRLTRGKGEGRGRAGVALTILIAGVMVAMPGRQELVMGGISAAFMALAYVQLEEGGEEWVQLGREAGLYLVVGFFVAAVALENEAVVAWQGRGWGDVVLRNAGGAAVVAARVLGVGILDAARWALLAVLVSRSSAVAPAFVELAAALLGALWAAFTVVKAVAAAGALGAMAWWFAGVQLRLLHAAAFIAVCTALSLLYATHAQKVEALRVFDARPAPIVSTSNHPIPKLIQEAEDRYYTMRERQSKTLEQAVKEYKRRYKMSPPPNFDQWYYFAKQRGAVIIDEYDTVYHSLKPFWGMSPRDVRTRARQSMGYKLTAIMQDTPAGVPAGDHQTQTNKLLHAYIRSGEVQTDGPGPEWQKKAAREMMAGFVKWLPDMDLPFNIHDEPRVMVPYEALHQHLEKAEQQTSQLAARNSVRNSFTPLKAAEKAIPPVYPHTPFNSFAHQSIFSHSILSCPPDSPVHAFATNISSSSKEDKPSGQLLGFIVNATESSDICQTPSLETRHGFFDRPNTFNVAKQLYPVFSQSKVSSYGDIVYPSPWYWAHKVSYQDSLDPAWAHKIEKLYWRGSTTGGYSRNGGWRRHHRQRVVSVIDANDTAKILEADGGNNWNITEVPRESLKELFDVYFSHIGQCDPEDCDEQREFFHVAPVANQQDAWRWKYLLDMDGNAFSGRYYAFLKSRSVVFKLAVFREWHEEWLHPWVHYIPLSMELEEVAEIMRFFRYEKEGERYAKRIAEESRSWAMKVLRDQDLEVWLFRLLLEYGRVVDENRDTIGFDV
jgi:hypothetical protein